MSIWLSYYADDFTGATDSLQVLAEAGLRSMLFLEPPEPAMLKSRYPGLECVGVAGVSRAMTPAQMEARLKPELERMLQLKTPYFHYKICSTCDSSPALGSVGKVIEMVRPRFSRQPFVPLLAAAPQLGRYTAFGHHFAAVQGEVFRLDRHPVMSRHPATPMDEADLRLHYGRQTALRLGLLGLPDYGNRKRPLLELALEKDADILILDAADSGHMHTVGSLLQDMAGLGPVFVVGSSGVQLALAASRRREGQGGASASGGTSRAGDAAALGGARRPAGSPAALADRQTLALSGSCSIVTRRQIESAIRSGFKPLPLQAGELAASPERESAAVRQLTGLLAEGYSVIAYTALGPDDPTIALAREQLGRAGMADGQSGEWIGQLLGRIARRAVEQTNLRRVVLAGGDTSGFAAKELGIAGMELLRAAAPGAPLCLCHGEDPLVDGLELALKGGQLGQEDYFERIRTGG